MERVEEQNVRRAKVLTPSEKLERVALLNKLRCGDHSAYEEVHKRYKVRLHRTALRILRNDAAAEDAVQDALLLAFSRIKSFDGRSSFYTWLTSILTNCCLGELRKQRRRPSLSLDDVFDGDTPWTETIESPQALVDDLLILGERTFVLDKAVSALQPDHRFILVARAEQNLSLAEIARQLGISLAAAKSRALRARKLCAQNARVLMGTQSVSDAQEYVVNKQPGFYGTTHGLPSSGFTGVV